VSHLHEPLDGRLFGDDQPCFGCGPKHPVGFHLAFERDGDEVVTRFTPGKDHQGAPGLMHGGLAATLADEIAAWAIIATSGKFGFTVQFDARYRKGLRVGVPIEGRGRLVSPVRRLADVEVRLLQDGDVAFTGAFKFAVLNRDAAEKLLGGPIPEAWAKFCR
jgi:acyl-coenzyme A thioesterase PaaI-like protein